MKASAYSMVSFNWVIKSITDDETERSWNAKTTEHQLAIIAQFGKDLTGAFESIRKFKEKNKINQTN